MNFGRRLLILTVLALMLISGMAMAADRFVVAEFITNTS